MSLKNNEPWEKLQEFYCDIVVKYVNIIEASPKFGNQRRNFCRNHILINLKERNNMLCIKGKKR